MISASCVSALNTFPGVRQPHRSPVISIHGTTSTIYDYYWNSKSNVTLSMFSHTLGWGAVKMSANSVTSPVVMNLCLNTELY